MLVGIIAAPTYTFTHSLGICLSEIPFMIISLISIPYLIMINSRRYYNKYDSSSVRSSINAQPKVNKSPDVIAEELKKFKELLDSDAITQEEYG